MVEISQKFVAFSEYMNFTGKSRFKEFTILQILHKYYLVTRFDLPIIKYQTKIILESIFKEYFVLN